MIRKLKLAILATLVVTPAFSGTIEGACNRSKREASHPVLCNCIQQVADMTLSRSDQSRAAGFFKDPDKAHNVWMSQKGSDDSFWDRYTAFSDLAQAYCAVN